MVLVPFNLQPGLNFPDYSAHLQKSWNNKFLEDLDICIPFSELEYCVTSCVLPSDLDSSCPRGALVIMFCQYNVTLYR